jgi:hypothetical protein
MSLRSFGFNNWFNTKQFESAVDGLLADGKQKEVLNQLGKAFVYLLPKLKFLFNFVVLEVRDIIVITVSSIQQYSFVL